VSGLKKDAIKILFNLPYRCSFGENLAIVGSGEPLGAWDPDRSVPLTWSEGDVWQGEIEMDSRWVGPDSTMSLFSMSASHAGFGSIVLGLWAGRQCLGITRWSVVETELSVAVSWNRVVALRRNCFTSTLFAVRMGPW
jgi:hypothetical protein